MHSHGVYYEDEWDFELEGKICTIHSVKNVFTSDPLMHVLCGAVYFAFVSDILLQIIDFTLPADLYKKLNFYFNSLPTSAISNFTDTNCNFSFCSVISDLEIFENSYEFQEKWENCLSPLNESFYSPRSSTPL